MKNKEGGWLTNPNVLVYVNLGDGRLTPLFAKLCVLMGKVANSLCHVYKVVCDTFCIGAK